MTKELKEFYTLRASYCIDEFNLRPYEIERFKIIETALKALEIIKEKTVDCYFLSKYKSLDEYNSGCLPLYPQLTKEEYNLLKKVLK